MKYDFKKYIKITYSNNAPGMIDDEFEDKIEDIEDGDGKRWRIWDLMIIVMKWKTKDLDLYQGLAIEVT